MTEKAIRREPLDGAEIAVRNRLLIAPGFPMTRYVLRGEVSTAEPIAKAFGAVLPAAINTASGADSRAILMLGPDEWLLIAPEADEARLADLAKAADQPHALVDVSHRNMAILVSGALATEVLSAISMLDLDPMAFPVGMATRTLFVKAEVILWRTGLDSFHIELWRSFADYLFQLLSESSREYVKA